MSNRLFDRLIETNAEDFRTKLKDRWFFLRQNNFKVEIINQRFNDWFYQLNTTDIIEKENRIWNEKLDMQKEEAYIKNWASERLDFLDDYFLDL